jgi:hypothetical protein
MGEVRTFEPASPKAPQSREIIHWRTYSYCPVHKDQPAREINTTWKVSCKPFAINGDFFAKSRKSFRFELTFQVVKSMTVELRKRSFHMSDAFLIWTA